MRVARKLVTRMPRSRRSSIDVSAALNLNKDCFWDSLSISTKLMENVPSKEGDLKDLLD